MLKEKNIKTPNGEIYYRINDNPVDSEVCLLFCHGLTADHSLFEKQIDAFINTNRLLLLDLPLHGKSRLYQNFTFRNVVADLNAIVEREKVEKLIFVGQSAGGYIAQAFIDIYPDKVMGFAGIGTTPFGPDYYKKSELFWIRHFTAIARLYPYPLYCRASSEAAALTEEARANMYAALRRLGKKGMLIATGAVYREFLNVKKRVRFSFPALLTYGESDKVGFVKKYNQQWAESEKIELTVLKRASHNANYDNFEDFNDLLKGYIKKISSNI